jgi:hypothetical protein
VGTAYVHVIGANKQIERSPPAGRQAPHLKAVRQNDVWVHRRNVEMVDQRVLRVRKASVVCGVCVCVCVCACVCMYVCDHSKKSEEADLETVGIITQLRKGGNHLPGVNRARERERERESERKKERERERESERADNHTRTPHGASTQTKPADLGLSLVVVGDGGHLDLVLGSDRVLQRRIERVDQRLWP